MDSGIMPCLNVIRQLRQTEEIMLYGNLLSVSAEDLHAVTVFLRDEFEKESLDGEDALIPILENHLQRWHYSGISYALDTDKLDYSLVGSDPCLHALYCNRIISERKMSLATHHLFADSVRASMSIYGKGLWKELTETTDLHLYDKY